MNAKNEDGATALLVASEKDDLMIVHELLVEARRAGGCERKALDSSHSPDLGE